VTLQNPLSRERSVLRPSLMPGLLDVLALNANRGNPDARVFEIGHIFAPRRAEDVDRPVHEELWAGIALTGIAGAAELERLARPRGRLRRQGAG
jgi:phenylalanyl-tRNA synthetase beta chain